jgi:hypothetical protein
MFAKVVLVLVGILLAGVFLNVYGVFLALITGLLLGIKDGPIVVIEYWLCLLAGSITSFAVIRRAWPKERSPPQ